MRRRGSLPTAIVLVSILGAVMTSVAHAQIGATPFSGGAPGTIRPLPPNPPAPLVSPALPRQQWVPEQRQYDPATGRQLLVPGHTVEVTPDGRLVQPPIVVPSPSGRPPAFLPGGESLAPGVAR